MMEIVFTAACIAPPLGQIKLTAAFARSHRGSIDGSLESMRELYLGDLATALGNYLRGNISPEDRDQFGHEWSTASVSLCLKGCRI
jgi:hypothetical protein